MKPHNAKQNLPVQQRQVRKSHTRSRFGCPTCKQRRIKCDETLPTCLNCSMVKKIRCGYLDYTPDQIHMIQMAHQQEERLRLNVFIQEHPSVSNSPASSSSSSQSQIRTPTPTPYTSLSPIHREISFKDYETNDTYNNDRNFNPTTNTNTSFNINLVPHSTELHAAKSLPIYFNETQSSYYFRIKALGAMFDQVFHATFRLLSFFAALLLSSGILLSKKLPKLKEMYLKIRGDAVQELLKNLENVKDENAGDLWCLSMTLDASSVYFNNDIGNYGLHSKLSLGPSSVMETIYKNPSEFPSSYKRISFFGNSLLQTTKSLWIPHYDYRILYEFREVVIDFGKTYIINQKPHSHSHSHSHNQQHKRMKSDPSNTKLHKEWLELIAIIDCAIDIFKRFSSDDLPLKYPLNKLYELFQIWFNSSPSEAAILDNSRMGCVEKVFYLFWLTLLKELEAIIVNSTYVFTFFIHGFFFLHPFKKDEVFANLQKNGNDDLIWYFNYCSRVISFLDRRMTYIITNPLLSNDSIIKTVHLRYRLKSPAFESNEKFIIKFKSTVIKKEHYPGRLMKLGNNKRPNYNNYDNANNNETVDLLRNVNLRTSLLYNDYDPRFIDKETFDKSYSLFNVDLEFISKYVQDRKLLIKMTNDSIEYCEDLKDNKN